MLKDFLWMLFKDNYIVNLAYFFVYYFFIRTKNIKTNPEVTINKFKKHPAYKNFDWNSSIDKVFVKRNASSFYKMKGVSVKAYTSGTTNSPLELYRSLPSAIIDELSLRSHWYSVGVKVSPRIATLRGDNLFPGDHEGKVFWKKMLFSRRLIMSSFHLNEKTAKDYLLALEHHKPDIILAYPSTIRSLANYAKKIQWKPNWHLQGVFTSGESFSRDQQKDVKSIFGSLFDHYGQAERVARMQQCELGNYHFIDWYSKIELLESNDETKKVIVGTSLWNSSMPLYRYNTGDLVSFDAECKNCPCGIKSSFVAEILGRPSIEITLPNGTLINSAQISLLFYGIDGIAEAQVIQKLDRSIEVLFTSSEESKNAYIANQLDAAFEQRFGSEVTIAIRSCTHIPRAESGKLQPLLIED